jgi:hypothetical protein
MALTTGDIVEYVLICLGAFVGLCIYYCCWDRRGDSAPVAVLFGLAAGCGKPLLLLIAPLEFIGKMIYLLLRRRLYIALARFLNGLVCAVLGGFAAYTCAALRHSPPDTMVLGWKEWTTNSLMGAVMVRDPCDQLPLS